MSGQTELLTVEDKLKKLDSVLDEYEQSVGVSLTNLLEEHKIEADNVLKMTHSQLSKMSPRECGEAAFILQRYAFHLQKCSNREQARIRWAEESIKKVISSRLAQQKGSSFEERKMLAIKENDVASKLDEIRIKALFRTERLNFLSNKIDGMARALMNIQQRV